MKTFYLWITLGGTWFLAMMLGACSDNSSDARDGVGQPCQYTEECPHGLACIRQVCQDPNAARTCFSSLECYADEQCIQGICTTASLIPDETDLQSSEDLQSTDILENTEDLTQDQEEYDFGSDLNDDIGDTSTEEDTWPPYDADDDIIPPSIVSHTPAADAQDIDVQVQVQIVFDEAVVGATATSVYNVFIWDYDKDDRVPAHNHWDASTLTLTITPDQPLLPFSPYRVVVTNNVVDYGGNSINYEEWIFYTGGREPELAALLAQAYAPTLYQDGVSPITDVPVAIDGDGDFFTRNNAPNLLANALSRIPTVYYQMAETKTHYFIHYVLYYPIYQLTESSDEKHHTVNGVLVVVQRDGTQLGHLQMVQTYSAGQDFNPARLDTYLPDCTSSSAPYCPSNIQARSSVLEWQTHRIPAGSYADQTAFRHVPLYIHPRHHNLCHLDYDSGLYNGYCARGGELYTGTMHVVLTPSEHPSSVGVIDFSQDQGEYRLLPLIKPWWLQRVFKGDYDYTFYLNAHTFSVDDATLIGGNGNMILPKYLNTTPGDQRSNNVGRYSPFAWTASGLDEGRWLLDPAYSVQALYDMGPDFSYHRDDYCYEIFVGIDRTEDDPACQPAARHP